MIVGNLHRIYKVVEVDRNSGLEVDFIEGMVGLGWIVNLTSSLKSQKWIRNRLEGLGIKNDSKRPVIVEKRSMILSRLLHRPEQSS